MSNSDFIKLSPIEVKWRPGIIFAAEDDHTSGAYWLVEKVDGDTLVYSHPNRPAYGKSRCTIASLGHCKYFFVKRTLQPIDKTQAVIDKIKYLNQRYVTRNQQKPVPQVSTNW